MLSYIINHRGRSGYRLDNLVFLVEYLKRLNDIEIIVVEQDSEAFLINHNFGNKCKYVFLKSDGLFNHSWGFNAGYKRATYNLLAFGDNDVMITDDAFRQSVDLLNQNFIVNPYTTIVNTSLEEANIIRITRTLHPITREGRGHVNFCGGLVFFTRSNFEKVGGWDENFRGWGGEDNAMSDYQIPLVIGKDFMKEVEGVGYHLWHDRTIDDSFHQSNYKNNLSILRWYETASAEDILKNINIDIIGYENKYI